MASNNSVPDRPPFASLPLDPTGPPGNAWGLYGKDDALGSLNMLTPAVVAAAAKQEIRTGERVSLDWVLTKPAHPSFGRPPFKWTRTVRTEADGRPRCVNDDHLDFNTQCSSQWDGFRHYGYAQAMRFYNNVTLEQLHDPSVIGIDVWVEKGGIVGRGVLLDYAGYCAAHNRPLAPMESTAITLADLKAVVAEQGVALHKGDILFIRSGYTAAYEALAPAAQQALATRPAPDYLGVEPTAAMAQWIWESHWAVARRAVGGRNAGRRAAAPVAAGRVGGADRRAVRPGGAGGQVPGDGPLVLFREQRAAQGARRRGQPAERHCDFLTQRVYF
ncbi:hypothetical protein SPI_00158 [Niveomyces insectorum RCEF 264]|uniref:Cyclase n=1 Tax=Niveomyces insectorum RCEF 264 TaxID=1081102 RepID=A0A167ZW26_9HYPO|nr:hypothetical protein SPI_00158 [Niveomyces insectorum RCEF 264]